MLEQTAPMLPTKAPPKHDRVIAKHNVEAPSTGDKSKSPQMQKHQHRSELGARRIMSNGGGVLPRFDRSS